MTGSGDNPVRDFRARFEESGGDLRLDVYLAEHGWDDDDLLADLIAADARLRRQRGERVRLEDYLNTLPDLTTRTIPLDAAVEAALRSSIAEGDATIEAVERLAESHPDLRTLIEEAAVLGRLLPTTTQADTAASRPLPTLAPGETIGEPMPDGRRRYLVRERIGAGAQGEVYLAVDQRLTGDAGEALVAIKTLRRADDDIARRRFIEEAARARRIDHPNVVRVIDRSESNGREFIVFDYVEGGTLDAFVRECGGRLSLREAARLGEQIARGVQAAHAAGLVHGDLKPGNILLTKGGQPKIADFGIAALLHTDADSGETEGMQGNLAFMAPEQFRMESRSRSPLIDVYAIGGLLYWMVNGRSARGESLAEVLDSHRDHVSPAREGDIAETDLDLVVRRALSHDPADRQPAAGALADDLEAWLERRPIGWTRPPVSRVAHLWFRRRPRSAVGVLLLACVAVGALVAAVVLSSIANGARDRFEAMRATLDAESAEHATLRNSMLDIVGDAMRARRLRFHGADAFNLWVMELIARDELLAEDGLTDIGATDRRIYLERLVDQAHRDGRHIQEAHIRTLLGVYMLDDRDYAAAATALEPAVVSFQRMSTADDPTVMRAQALLATAITFVESLESHERMTTLEAQIGDALPFFDPSSPAHPVMLDALRRLYAPDMLNMPDRLDALDATATDAVPVTEAAALPVPRP